MNKILILAALMLTGCDGDSPEDTRYSVEGAHIPFSDGSAGRACVKRANTHIQCLPLTSENIKKMQALADELNGLSG